MSFHLQRFGPALIGGRWRYTFEVDGGRRRYTFEVDRNGEHQLCWKSAVTLEDSRDYVCRLMGSEDCRAVHKHRKSVPREHHTVHRSVRKRGSTGCKKHHIVPLPSIDTRFMVKGAMTRRRGRNRDLTQIPSQLTPPPFPDASACKGVQRHQNFLLSFLT